MPRSATRRIRRYQRKFDVGHVTKQLELAKEEMVTLHAQAQAELEEVEIKGREILGEHNVPTVQFPSYLNFIRQAWKLRRNFSGKTLETEIQIILDKWVARKLDKKVLEDLRFRLFSVKEPAE